MINKIWHAIGAMSGTSLDGVDLVYVKISRDLEYNFSILEKKSIIYSELWKNKLMNAFHVSAGELDKLDREYGIFLGKLIQNFILEKKILQVDFIASHGHTIFHKPEENYTLQIGGGAEIASMTNTKVICDFRTQDVLLGGQGAPLVPIGDMLLFGEYSFCLNLGGFANISFQKENLRKAFDICPVNIVLNHYTRKIDIEYDDKGRLARQGKVQNKLLSDLNNLSFYNLNEPKSLGYEFVSQTIIPLIDSFKLPIKDILRTFIEHIAIQISDIINTNDSRVEKKDPTVVLVTGGGVYNDFLIDRLSFYSTLKLKIPTDEIIEFKEALIFALLGVLRDQNEVNCLRSVTGASRDHSSGEIFYPLT